MPRGRSPATVVLASAACLLACSMIRPTRASIVWSLDDADTMSDDGIATSSSGVNASLLGFGDGLIDMYVDVARVGGALRFGETRALTATLPPSHDLAAGTVSFWFQPEFDTATTTAVHDLFIVGPNTYSTGRVHIFNNG